MIGLAKLLTQLLFPSKIVSHPDTTFLYVHNQLNYITYSLDVMISQISQMFNDSKMRSWQQNECCPPHIKGWFEKKNKKLFISVLRTRFENCCFQMSHNYLFYFTLSNETSLKLLSIEKELSQLLVKNNKKWYTLISICVFHLAIIKFRNTESLRFDRQLQNVTIPKIGPVIEGREKIMLPMPYSHITFLMLQF